MARFDGGALAGVYRTCAGNGGTAVAGAIFTLALALRVAYGLVQAGASADEANTLLFSGCRLTAYQAMVAHEQPPLLVGATVADWRRFVQAGCPLCPVQVFRGSANDVHPPLFYEVLHLWRAVVGSSLFGARLLNVCIDLLSALVFYRLARELLERCYARLAVLFYAVAPGFFLVSGEVRSYALLGLWNLVAVWAVLRILRRGEDRRWWIVWALASVGGLYTHYVFVLVLAATAAVLLVAAVRRRPGVSLPCVGGFVCLVAAALLPLLLLLRHQLAVATATVWAGGSREGIRPLGALAWVFLDALFGAPRRVFEYPAVVDLLVVLPIVGFCAYGLAAVRERGERWSLLWLTAVSWMGYVALYALGALPPHATGAKYQVVAVPYFLLSLTYVASRLPGRRWRWAYGAVVSVSMLAGSLRLTALAAEASTRTVSPTSVARRVPATHLVLLDHTFSGLVLPVVLAWPASQRIMIGSQRSLLDKADLERSAAGGSVAYVSTLSYGNTEEARRRILERLEHGSGGGPEEGARRVAGLGCRGCGSGYDVFVIRPRRQPVVSGGAEPLRRRDAR